MFGEACVYFAFCRQFFGLYESITLVLLRSLEESVSFLYLPLYSKKLHILTLRARTNCVASFTIFAFSLGGIVMNHFVRRTFPCRLTSNNQFIYSKIGRIKHIFFC